MTADAERAVLGAVMLSRAACDEVAEILQPSDMSSPKHEVIYSAVRRLHDRDEPTDTVAVTDELLKSGELFGNLDAAYVNALTSEVTATANASYWAGIVAAAAVRRRVGDAVSRAGAIVSDASVPSVELVERVRETFDDVDATTSRGVESIGDWFLGYAESLAEKPSYTPTPWHDLNQLIFGFRNGGMYVVAARPGDGKSIMAVQIALSQARQRPVLFVSLEMNREEIAARAIAALGQIFIGSLNKHSLSDAEWKAFAKHRADLEALPLVIVDSSEVSTIPQLKAKARAVRRRYKQNPVVIVDYLQLLEAHERVENRQQAVAKFSRSLKLAAQQWKVPVIALSQLNRGGANRKGKDAEPQLTDLRESGAIEQDADVVALLHRVRGAGRDELKVIVAKSRQGQTGELTLVWQGQFSRVLSKYQVHEQIDFNQKGTS